MNHSYFIVMLICNFNFTGYDRLEAQVYYFSFIFLIVSGLLVGSVISSEYNSTLKELLMAVNNRGLVYLTKLVSIIIGISTIYLVYTVGLTLTNSQISVGMIFNQYFSVLNHTLLILCIAYMIKSPSALLVVSVVLLCIYRELSNMKGSGFWSYLLDSTYYVMFYNLNFNKSSILIGCIISAFSIIVGYKSFNSQDIS